jgi:hypothetical protein
MKYIIVLAALLLTACGTSREAPSQELILDKEISPLTRNEVINGVTECEGSGLRPYVITTKRRINGHTTDIPVEVTCMPRYR